MPSSGRAVLKARTCHQEILREKGAEVKMPGAKEKAHRQRGAGRAVALRRAKVFKQIGFINIPKLTPGLSTGNATLV
jgi:hypothetical protein